MIYLAEYRTHNSVEEIKATEKAQKQKHKLKGNACKVYERIVSASFGNLGACKLKSQTIADDLGISRSTVTRTIKKLKDLHVIDVIKDTKSNGIKGANIYAVIFLTQDEPSSCAIEMSHRETHENPTVSTFEHTKIESESLELKHSFNLKDNFVVKNVYPPVTHGTKDILKEIYKPDSTSSSRNFEELCKIGFGRQKQYMKSHSIPYHQMNDIIINCMSQLVSKKNVRNEFALYSSMIKRQVEQLFEKPVQAVSKNNKEIVPDWFEGRNEAVMSSTVVADVSIDFDAERAKVLAKLKGDN